MQFNGDRKRYHIFVIIGAMLLQGCADDTNDSTPDIPIDGITPVITSALQASVPEQSTGTIYTATANHADADEVLTYSIEGTDVAQFVIDSSTGEIEFASEPNFELPADNDFDNVYTFNLTVTDEDGESDSELISISVTDLAETGERYLDKIFANLEVQTDVEYAGGMTMDVYSPAGDAETDRPVIIIAFGGGFVSGDRSSVQEIAEDFARRGYVAATISYRLGSGTLDLFELIVAGINATHDMFAAVRFFRADALDKNEFGTRPDAIFVSGESSGGIMAAIAATLDANDTLASVLSLLLPGLGGLYGDVGDHDEIESHANGAFIIAGGILDLSWVDAESAVLYAAHFALDAAVPCETGVETVHMSGLEISGACDLVLAYQEAGAIAEAYLVQSVAGHTEFTDAQRAEIYDGAAALFFYSVILEKALIIITEANPA